MIFEFDDFGANHVISDQTQAHDCRDKLDALHFANTGFKVTLFSIPAEMTYELLEWCRANQGWVQLALHGFFHKDNWECSKLTYEEFDAAIKPFEYMLEEYFVKGFRAPGWQIGDEVYTWLKDHGYWVADQGYNDNRRPEMPAYVNYDGKFKANGTDVEAWHGHTWDCTNNGIYETYPELEARVKSAEEFKFISEVL